MAMGAQVGSARNGGRALNRYEKSPKAIASIVGFSLTKSLAGPTDRVARSSRPWLSSGYEIYQRSPDAGRNDLRVGHLRRYGMSVADFALLIEAPDRSWAEHVSQLMQRALGERGSVSVGLPGESLPDSPAAPGYVVSGVAVSDEPEGEMLDLITAKLVGYDMEVDRSGPATEIRVRPDAP